MRILLLGINHRTAPIELREKVALGHDQLGAVHDELRQRFPHAEHVVLSTCNRIECYIARPSDASPSADELRAFLAARTGVALDQLTAATIHREQDEALRHLFRVCAGLDSMVLGEPQVLGQVKRAYEAAIASDAVGPMLHRVFQEALGAAKRVRTQTSIGSGRVSVGSVAVDFVRQVFAEFTDKTIVGIGAGEMAKTTLRHLLNLAPHRLWLTNRSPQRAAQLAETLGLGGDTGGARPWEALDELLVEADIVLTSTGAEQPILTRDRFKPIARRRHNRPLFIIDIAVPRDVTPEVGSLNNVYLYNVDDLQTVIEAGVDQRAEQLEEAEGRISAAVSTCMHQLQHRDLGHLIRLLRQRLHDLGELEEQRTQRKLQNVADPATAEAVSELLDEHTRRLINKILHLPLSQLDDRHGELDAPLGFYAAALRRLFDLDETQEPQRAQAQQPQPPMQEQHEQEPAQARGATPEQTPPSAASPPPSPSSPQQLSDPCQ